MSVDPRGIVMDANYVAGFHDGQDEMKPELDRLRAEIAELREALEPFAKWGAGYYQPYVFEKAKKAFWGSRTKATASNEQDG